MSSNKKEVYYYYNNLVSVVKGLEGVYTAIDLRNESSITGRIDCVDGYMNVELSDAVYYDARGISNESKQMLLWSTNPLHIYEMAFLHNNLCSNVIC